MNKLTSVVLITKQLYLVLVLLLAAAVADTVDVPLGGTWLHRTSVVPKGFAKDTTPAVVADDTRYPSSLSKSQEDNFNAIQDCEMCRIERFR